MVELKTLSWTPEEERNAAKMMNSLAGYIKMNSAKYQRNYSRYQNNGKHATPGLWSVRSDIVPGYNVWAQRSPTDGVQTSINVLKSAIDTIVSKISQARVRPFFSAVRGDYLTIKSCRAGQEFFDGFFERENVYHLAAEVFRDACIFDKGILWADEDSERIRHVRPWQVYVDPSEWEYLGKDRLTRVGLQLDDFPMRAIESIYGPQESIKKDKKNPEESDQLLILWDLKEGEKWYFYCGKAFRRVKIEYKRPPFTWIYWTQPLKGYNSTSVIDENYTIQVDIDELNLRIDAATRNGLFNTVFVPKGSGIKASTLQNQGAATYEYDPGPTGGAGVTVATPPAINNQWVELLKFRIQTVYENIGVSQLSAQSKKPAGADSGRALQTLADMESERFNVALQAYLRMFIDLASVCIDVFPAEAEIVAGKYAAKTAKWKDVKRQRDSYSIQFSAGSALSKDPTRRLAEIDMMVQRGMIPKEQAAMLMQIPDLEGAYSTATAAYDYAQVVIERAIEDGKIEYEPITNLNLLFSEAVRWLLRLSADEANKKYRDNLTRLIEDVQKQLSKVETPQEIQAAPSMPPEGPAPAAVQAGTPMGV